MKTALQELIEKLEHTKMNSCKHLHEIVFFDGVLAIIKGGDFLQKEKQQIIEAYESCAATTGKNGELISIPGEQYYNETFNQPLKGI